MLNEHVEAVGNQDPFKRPFCLDEAHARSGEHHPVFLETWTLRLNEPSERRGALLQFTVLSTHTGFKRISEILFLFSQRPAGTDATHAAIRQVYGIESFQPGVRIGENELTPRSSRGNIQSKGKQIRWSLDLVPAQKLAFSPSSFSLCGLKSGKPQFGTLEEDLRISGSIEVDGKTIEIREASGTLSHRFGRRRLPSLFHGECNALFDDKGARVPAVFDGSSFRKHLLGPVLALPGHRFLFQYQGESYPFSTAWDSLRVHSHATPTEWVFRADRGELSFRGKIETEHRDFAGLSFEDTDGSILYSSVSLLSDFSFWVYRRGKLETTLRGPKTCLIEAVSPRRNPYIAVLV